MAQNASPERLEGIPAPDRDRDDVVATHLTWMTEDDGDVEFHQEEALLVFDGNDIDVYLQGGASFYLSLTDIAASIAARGR